MESGKLRKVDREGEERDRGISIEWEEDRVKIKR